MQTGAMTVSSSEAERAGGGAALEAAPGNGATAAQVAQLIPRNRLLRFAEGVVVGTLPNGLDYRIQRHAFPVGIVHAHLVVNAGSLHEDRDELGLAHLLEHCVFLGTERYRSADEMRAIFASLGMTFGGDVNAFTSLDETVYTLSCPASHHQAEAKETFAAVDLRKRARTEGGAAAASAASPSEESGSREGASAAQAGAALASGSVAPEGVEGVNSCPAAAAAAAGDANVFCVIDLLHQLSRRALLEAGPTFDQEKKAVEREKQLRNTIGFRVHKALLGQVYEGTELPHRMPIGDMDIVRACTPAQLRRFYEKWYRLRNMCVVVVGDVDATHVERTIRDVFGKDSDDAEEGGFPPPETAGPEFFDFFDKRCVDKVGCEKAARVFAAAAADETVLEKEGRGGETGDDETAAAGSAPGAPGARFTPPQFLRWACRSGRERLPDLTARFYRAAPRPAVLFTHDLLRTVSVTVVALEPPLASFDAREAFVGLVDAVVSRVLHARLQDVLKRSARPPFVAAQWDYVLAPAENCCTNVFSVTTRCSRWRAGLAAAAGEAARLAQHGCSADEAAWALASVMKVFRDAASQHATEDSREIAEALGGDWVAGAVSQGPVREFRLMRSLQHLVTQPLVNARAREVFAFLMHFGKPPAEKAGETDPRPSLFVSAAVRATDEAADDENGDAEDDANVGRFSLNLRDALSTAAAPDEEAEGGGSDLGSEDAAGSDGGQGELRGAETCPSDGKVELGSQTSAADAVGDAADAVGAVGGGGTLPPGKLTTSVENTEVGRADYISLEEVRDTLVAALVCESDTAELTLPRSLLDEAQIDARIREKPPRWLPPTLEKTDYVKSHYYADAVPQMDLYEKLVPAALESGGTEAAGGDTAGAEVAGGAAAAGGGGGDAFLRDLDRDICMASLDNGIRLSYKKTDFEPNRCVISLWFNGGRLAEAKLGYLPQALEIGLATIFDGGVAGVEAQMLARLLMLWDVHFDVGVHADGVSLRVDLDANETASRGSLEDVLGLLVAYWRSSEWSADAFERQRERRLVALQEAEKNIAHHTGVALCKAMFPGGAEPFLPATPDQVRQYSLDSVRELIDAQLQPDLLEMVVCGDFDEGALRRAVWRYLGSVPNTVRAVSELFREAPLTRFEPRLFEETDIVTVFLEDQDRQADDGKKRADGSGRSGGLKSPAAASSDMEGPPHEAASLEIIFPGPPRYGKAEAADLPPAAASSSDAKYADVSYRARTWKLLEEILSDRLQVEIREKRGLAYDVGASLAVFERLSVGTVNFSANPDPRELAHTWKAINDVVKQFCTDTPATAEEFERARGSLLSDLRANVLSSNDYWTVLLMSLQSASHPKTLGQIADVLGFYEGITLEDVRALAAGPWFRPQPTLVALSASGPLRLRGELVAAEAEVRAALAGDAVEKPVV